MSPLLVLAIVLVLAGVVAFFVMKKQYKFKKFAKPILVAGIALGILAGVGSCLRTVPTGHTGIVTTFGHVEDKTLEAGMHVLMPWNSVIAMDNRNQKATLTLYCFSTDIQEIEVTYTLNYQIDKQNAQIIFKTIGSSYYETAIRPRIEEAVKSVIATCNAEQLLEQRSKLSLEIKEILESKLAQYNIEVLDASIENLEFSEVFTTAVEAKKVAEQKAKQAEIEEAQKTMEAEAQAERNQITADAEAAVAIIAAEADLEVVKIQADAAEYAGQKDAAVIEQVRDVLAKDPANLTDEDFEHLLFYYYILEWDGELPETYIGSEDFYAFLASVGSGIGGTTAP